MPREIRDSPFRHAGMKGYAACRKRAGGKNLGDGTGLGLLQFLTPSDAPLRILTVEGSAYLPALRLLYPAAALYAVAAEEASLAGIPADVDAEALCLDYRETPLPYERESFDILLAPHALETVVNPQDIAAGFGTFLKSTGFFLTSFSNIRYWRILEELMGGHYRVLVRRLFAKPEFEILLSASFYKDVFFLPGARQEIPAELAARFKTARFEGPSDMATEVWLVQAWRSTRAVARLKAEYTPKVRRRLVTLCRRLEYGIDVAENGAALQALCSEEGITPRYFAAFTRETIVQRGAFRAALTAAGGWDAYAAFLDETWEKGAEEGGASDEE